MKNSILTAIFCTFLIISTKAQNNMELSSKHKSLVEIAAKEAKGDLNGLYSALNTGLDVGLTVSEAKEALSQLYAYTGFPRSLNALSVLQNVIADRETAGKKTDFGRESSALPKDYDAVKYGTEIQTKVSGRAFNYAFAPQTDYYLKAHLFGDIFVRDNLKPFEREIVTVSAIAVLPGCEPQLEAHVRGAINMGVSEKQLRAIPEVLREKVGFDEYYRAAKAIAKYFNEDFDDVKTVDFSIWPQGEFNAAFAEYFIGNSYLAPLEAQNGGPVNVTFEPKCRNNWHIHHKAVQVLICVAGRGWYQEWGKEPIELNPGTVIAIPAEVKHWHGAAKDSWFQHLTYHANVQEGSSTEWLEPVSDDVYNQLP